MITPIGIYLITSLDSVVGLLIGISSVALIASLFISACTFEGVMGGYGQPRLPKLTKRLFAVGLIAGTMAAVIPSTKQAAAIILIPKIANNEQLQGVPDKAAQLLSAKLDEWIKDTIGGEK